MDNTFSRLVGRNCSAFRESELKMMIIKFGMIFILMMVTIMGFSPAYSAPEQPNAPANTITVNSHLDTSGDGGICTLRDAINAANSNAAAGGCPAGAPYPAMDTINIPFSSLFCKINPCTIILSSPLPTVIEDVTIQGTGTWTPVVSGAYTYRVFNLGGVVVNISNINIIRGNAAGTSTAGYGGAILTSDLDTTLQVSSVGFYENHAQTRGGAIYVPGGTVTINNSSFSGNTVDYYGGAIDQTGGVLIITASTLSGNSAGDGGALEVQSASDTRLTNVTISGNKANGRGGGISRIGTTYSFSMNNVTVTNNTADFDNNAGGDGGGIYRGGGTVVVSNSIIAGNFDTPNNSGAGTINPDCAGTVTSFGFNLIGSGEGCAGFTNGVNGDKVGTNANLINPLLNALGSFGGFTPTQPPLPYSPAIDAGNPLTPGGGGFGACAAVDQRGGSRPQGSQCDIGAAEGVYGTASYLPNILK